MLIRNTRRDIARVNTVLGERLRGVTVTKKAPAPAPAAAADESAPKRQRAAKKQTPEGTET
jgi:hypothetical protein